MRIYPFFFCFCFSVATLDIKLIIGMDCDVASYHVESFNYLIDEGVHLAALDVPKEKFKLHNGDAIELNYTGAQLLPPTLEKGVAKLFGCLNLYYRCRQKLPLLINSMYCHPNAGNAA